MNRPPPPYQKNGYSILEVLVSIFIIAIIVGILGGMFFVLLRSFLLYSVRDELLTDASRMTDVMADTVRSAYGIEATRTIDTTSFTSGKDTIIVKIASIDQNGDPIPSSFDYMVFTRNGADPTLVRQITDADPASTRKDQDRVLGHNVSDLTFLYKNGTPETSTDVYGSVTVTKNVVRTQPTLTLHYDAKLRNK